MKEKEIKELEESLSTMFFDKLVHSLFKDGTITISEFDNKEKLLEKILKINAKTEYKVVVDYKEDLLNTARQFNELGKVNNAKIFYATYFEHQLNGIIDELCTLKSINKKEINNIIKSINLAGKLTWLPLILEIPKISVKHKNVILKLAGERNAFIHYKYNPEPDEIETNEKQKEQEDIVKIEKTITYLKKYTSRVLYKNKKTELETKLKNRKKN